MVLAAASAAMPFRSLLTTPLSPDALGTFEYPRRWAARSSDAPCATCATLL
jgi:hypothetical protein